MAILECVAFMLIRDGQVLAEKRKTSKKVAPGAMAIPGGHLEPDETIEQALHRELTEELAVKARQAEFVCTLLHRDGEIRRLHYFAVASWSGEISNNEAEHLAWIPLGDPSQLDLEVDRVAVAEYLRVIASWR